MADILIRGMEMPVQCVSCPMWSLEGVGDGRYMDLCRVMMAPLSNPYKRPSDCPLIALPDGHGRLVDADELPFADKIVIHLMMFGGERVYTQTAIDEAPTIVPAEKEDVGK